MKLFWKNVTKIDFNDKNTWPKYAKRYGHKDNEYRPHGNDYCLVYRNYTNKHFAAYYKVGFPGDSKVLQAYWEIQEKPLLIREASVGDLFIVVEKK